MFPAGLATLLPARRRCQRTPPQADGFMENVRRSAFTAAYVSFRLCTLYPQLEVCPHNLTEKAGTLLKAGVMG